MYALASLGAPPLLRGRRGTIHVLTHSLTHSLTNSLTYSLTHSLMQDGWVVDGLIEQIDC